MMLRLEPKPQETTMLNADLMASAYNDKLNTDRVMADPRPCHEVAHCCWASALEDLEKAALQSAGLEEDACAGMKEGFSISRRRRAKIFFAFLNAAREARKNPEYAWAKNHFRVMALKTKNAELE